MRVFFLLVFGAGIFVGMRAEQSLQQNRCLDAGGVFDQRSLCIGVQAE